MNEVYEKYIKPLYEKRKADGLCVQCGGERDREKFITCSRCANVDGRRSKYRDSKDRSFCIECHQINDRAPKVLCSKCAPIQQKRTEKCQLQVKIDTFNAYGGCFCKCCGESTLVFLTLDHIDGGGSQHRKQLRKGKGDSGGGGNKTYQWLKKNGYPPGYRVFCFNCNHATHILGVCPHHNEHGLNIAQKAALLINYIPNSESSAIN